MLGGSERDSRRIGWLRAVILFVLLAVSGSLVVGCAGKVKPNHLDPAFDPLAATDVRYAVAGFVAAETDDPGDPSLAGDTVAQSDAWAPILHVALLGAQPGLVVWAWPAVRDNVPPDGVGAVQAACAAGDPVTSGMLAQLSRDLPEVAYLVLARLDRNEVETTDYDQPGLMNEDAREDRDVELMPNSLQRIGKIRRTVDVTLTIYDLERGRPVWRGSISRNRTELLSPKSVAERRDLVVTPATEEGELPELEMRGASLDPPALEALLADACRALAENLFAPPE